MVQPRRDIMAQGIYLAQVAAAKGNCKCECCRIIRRITKTMTEQFLSGDQGNPGDNPAGPSAVAKEFQDIIKVGGAEE